MKRSWNSDTNSEWTIVRNGQQDLVTDLGEERADPTDGDTDRRHELARADHHSLLRTLEESAVHRLAEDVSLDRLHDVRARLERVGPGWTSSFVSSAYSSNM